jgi:acyl carrier protein
VRWYLAQIDHKLCLKTRHQELERMSARETLRATLVNLLEEEMGEKYPLPQDDQDLRESMGLDSVDVVGLVMRIEREFRVRLSPEELANVKVVGDLLDLMEVKLANQTVGQSNGDPRETKPEAN